MHFKFDIHGQPCLSPSYLNSEVPVCGSHDATQFMSMFVSYNVAASQMHCFFPMILQCGLCLQFCS
jgi:hypothetical protein